MIMIHQWREPDFQGSSGFNAFRKLRGLAWKLGSIVHLIQIYTAWGVFKFPYREKFARKMGLCMCDLHTMIASMNASTCAQDIWKFKFKFKFF